MTPAGGSLEDCHTNVFVLTELNGLRWKCLTTPRNHTFQAVSSLLAGDQIEKDPVLRAYGECLNQGILCAWRRKPRGNCNAQDVSQDPTPQVEAQKELWIFWYSEEPACINTFKESGLVSSDDCEDDVSINYETRVLFFKTLHNVIERNLLRSGYVRFGKWFTCPLEMPVVDFERALPQYVNAIKFNFFLHGEDQVCVTVNVQRQPTLLRLAPCHLRASKGQPVILGPWSMRAILLPNQPLMNNSTGSVSASSSLKDKQQPSFTEIQAAVTKQWNDWKKFQALPLDDLDSTTTSPIKSMDGDKLRSSRAGGKSSSDSVVPKMVLVEIDGVRMFYPSCFVGILADELIAENRRPSCNNKVKSKDRKRFSRKGGNTSDCTSVSMSNGCGEDMARHHQNLADLSYSLEDDEINYPSGGGYSAEDHEVEEIMNASTASLQTEGNVGGGGLGKHRFLSSNVPSSLRHCRRSYAGVRASRRSLEDGCFSVLLGAKRSDCNDGSAVGCGGPSQPPSSIMSSSTTSGYMSSVEEDGMSTRWNFYDYMRRDFCYCKICSSNGAASSSETEGNQHLGDSATGDRECYAFHRSPNKPVSLASDFSPTFLDELSKADESESEINSDTEVRSMWVNKVASRSDVVVSGKLDLDSPIEADILKILPVNKEFDSSVSCVPPRPISPFTPIISITPEPDGSDEITDANFLQRLKDFDYVYKPMNRDIIPSQPYHNETRSKKTIGPPSENIYLKSNRGGSDTRLNVAISGNNGTNSANTDQSSLSVLKSLLDDDAPNSPSTINNDSVVPMRRLLTDVYGGGGMVKVFNGAPQPVSSSACRKKTRLKRLKAEKLAAAKGSCLGGGNGGQAEWPELQQLDTQLALIEFQDRMDKENIFENTVDESGLTTAQNEIDFCANNDFPLDFNNRSVAFPSHLTDRGVSGAVPIPTNHPNFMAVAAASMDPALFLQMQQQQRALTDQGLQPISYDEMKPGTGDGDVSGAPSMMTSVGYGAGEEEMDTSSPASYSAPITATADAAVITNVSDTAMTDAMTAVTPPALLSRLNDGGEDDNNLSRPMGDDGGGGGVSGGAVEEADLDVSRRIQNHQIQQQQHSSAHAPLSSLISSISGSNVISEHILSPPASNERVEFGNSNGNCIQQQSFLGALGGTAASSVMHDSLSIIYPTPPTPMQQFSPQNVMINAVQQLITTATNSASSCFISHQQQLGSCPGAGDVPSSSQLHQSQSLQSQQQRHGSPSSSTGSPLLVNNSVCRAKSTAGAIFNGDQTLSFPPSECFSGDLLDESLDVEEKLRIAAVNKKQLSTYSSIDYGSSASSSSSGYGAGKSDNNGSGRESALRDAFRSRSARVPVDLPPAYKRPPPEKIAKFGSSREAMDSDRRLAMALEKSEMMLLSAANRLHNFNFPPHHPHYQQMLQHHHNMMQQQHFMGSPVTPAPMMPPLGGPFSMNGIGNNNNNALIMTRGAQRGGSLINVQQQLLQQQQMMNNQMAGSGMLSHRPGMMPNFASNNVNNGVGPGGMQQMQMLNMLKQQQQQQSMMGSLGSPSSNPNQFGAGDATTNNGGTDEFGGGKQHFMSNGVFTPSSQQQQQTASQAMMNRFGGNSTIQKNALSSMQQMQQSPMFTNNMNSNNNSGGATIVNTAANTPSSSTPGGTSFAPFGSPLTSVSNGGNASATPALDYHISSVSSTSSSTGGGGGALVNATSVTTVSASSGTLFGTINIDGIINTFQQGRSFVIAILLQDTVLDLHFDSVFDACPICCCNANIRTYELGFYINATNELKRCDEIQQKQQQNSRFMTDYWSGFRVSAANLGSKCNCGFSAVRHRYLCGGWSGLFPEDSVEACGVLPPMLLVNRRSSVGRFAWFNPSSPTDLQFMDLLRQLSLTRDFCAMVRNAYYLGDFPDPSEKTVSIGGDVTQHCDYIVSRVDAVELDKVMGGIVDAAITVSGALDGDSASKDGASAVEICRPSKAAGNGGGGRPLYHWWGLQTANNVREPKDTECIAVIRGVQPLLEEAMRQSRGSQNYIKQFEGPLTWRSFLRKTSKGSSSAAAHADDSCQEQVPNIIVATEREPVVTSPQMVSMWEKLSLAPYDQTKDVLYLAVVPDCAVVVEKCRIFMEELSSQYEKCRFGCHVRVNVKDAPRDGIIRLNHRPTNSTASNAANNNHNANLNFIAQFERELDDRRAATARLKAFVENMELELTQFFKANDAVFDRRAFHESVYRQTLHQNFTSLASSTDSSNMPPPAVPIQSPSSVLSSASGPSSANATMMMTGGGGVTQQQQSSLQQSSISPNGVPGGGQQGQISPAAGPNSAPSASNVCGGGGGSTLEELTLDGGGNGGGGSLTPNPQQQHQQQLLAQQQQQSQQDQATMEASIEKTVEEMLSVESVGFHLPHVLVIYVVNPFLFGADAHHAVFARVATTALMRAFNSFVNQLPVRRRPQLQLEVLSLQSLYDYTSFVADPLREDRQCVEPSEMDGGKDKMSARDCLRKIAFSVYSQPRFLLPEHTRGFMQNSMTRFGPASAFGDILDALRQRPINVSFKPFKVSSSPFVLAPRTIGALTSHCLTPPSFITTNASSNVAKAIALNSSRERVLFVTYCIIGDEWLCGAVTDEQGHLLDNVLINLVAIIPPPPASTSSVDALTLKYTNRSQIFDAIQRLWLYIQSVLVTDTRNWRLVIGRVGKIGHGEFKAWTETLSKRNLRTYNNNLKSRQQQQPASQMDTKPPMTSDGVGGILAFGGGGSGCKSCALIPGYQEMPAIISACLVTTEPELYLRIFPASVQNADGTSGGGTGINGGTSMNLFTASVSSSGGSGSTGSGSSSSKASKTKTPQGGAAVGAATASGDDTSITHIMVFPTMLDISLEQHVGDTIGMQDDNDDFDDFFSGNNAMQDVDDLDYNILKDVDVGDDMGKEGMDTTIDNQPMATGYYISTAPALDLPDWFWSACPSARRRTPVHLKNSLHIHTGNIQQNDEIAITNKSGGGASAAAHHHPLDSTATDEVLRYVLETYNALSWMNVDFANGSRQSCLPIHIQALLRLYRGVTTLFS